MNTNVPKFYLLKEMSSSMRELIITADNLEAAGLLAEKLLITSFLIEAYFPVEVNSSENCCRRLPHCLRSQAI